MRTAELVERLAAARGSARARAPPRRASGDGAGWSSRARRARRPRRARHPAAGPRRGARPRRGAPGRRRRRRRPGRASRAAAATAASRSAAASTRRMPRPPPPAAALTRSGKPIVASRHATRRRPAGSGSKVPGTMGTPSDAALRRAASLSPRTASVAASGRRRSSPAASTASAKAACSERNP